jgi:hypothetical protein
MRKFLLTLVGLAGIIAPLAFVAPANAATTSSTYSSAPTIYAPNVARGKTIPITINAHGSKVLSRSNTLWQNGHRVYDWSPKPGLYKVKSVIRYQIKKTTTTWTSDPQCLDDGWSDEQCRDWWEGTEDKAVTYLASRLVTRYDYARVAADETPGCVSGAEFNLIKNGMSQSRVHSIFGTSGRVMTSGSGGVSREYATCEGNRDWSYVEVDEVALHRLVLIQSSQASGAPCRGSCAPPPAAFASTAADERCPNS